MKKILKIIAGSLLALIAIGATFSNESNPSITADTTERNIASVAPPEATPEITQTPLPTPTPSPSLAQTPSPAPTKKSTTTLTSTCDPNYSEACVPIASDVDCEGGRGNGPKYVHGPVRVIGRDIYDLDQDGDGWGCD